MGAVISWFQTKPTPAIVPMIVWLHQGQDGEWKPFSPVQSTIIESAYQDYCATHPRRATTNWLDSVRQRNSRGASQVGVVTDVSISDAGVVGRYKFDWGSNGYEFGFCVPDVPYSIEVTPLLRRAE
jgi:hypothetical protein